MAENTKIQWCDHSASPWHGCQHAELPDGTPHPGCLNCYAETNAGRNPGTLGIWGSDGTRVLSKSFWTNCRRWNREAEAAGVRQSVFPSICDPFEDWQGPMMDHKGRVLRICIDDGSIVADSGAYTNVRPFTMDDARRDLFALIDECPWLDFLLLTKRPGNIRRMWLTRAGESAAAASIWSHRHNIALITSVSDQPTADELIPQLLLCGSLCPVLGVSAEPLLGPVTFRWAKWQPFGANPGDKTDELDGLRQLDWIIVGGESGGGARACDVEWIRSIVGQCKAAGVPVFCKQIGSVLAREIGSCDKKGGLMDDWPADIQCREFPNVKA